MSKNMTKDMNRRFFLKAAVVAGAATALPTISVLQSQLPVRASALAASPQSIYPFLLNQVTLQNGAAPFTGNRDRTYSYLLFLNDDRMLYNFKVAAGLSTNGAAALGGWDAPDVKLRGHSTGHYLTALAQAYASTGNSQYLTKINYMVTELGKCQDASPSRGYSTGYLAGYPEDQFIQLENLATYPTIWAPYYTCHKIMAGLLACYQLAGNSQALTIVTRMANWVYGRLSKLTRTRLQQMWALYIAGEYGGMNETLAEIYAITGNANHLTAATYFDNDNLFPALSNNQDTLGGKHANQHIPQITGALRVYDQNNTPYYYGVAENFWNIVTGHHMYCIGGTGEGEMFRSANAIAAYLTASTCETCATYNMLKLTRQLFFHHPDPRYMDYYERGLYNHILASQNQASSHGFVTYFVPLNAGGTKTYTNDYNSFTCCHGTGMENHTKYQDTIYAYSGETLYVNLFIPSTLNWASRGITVTQVTNYPEANTTRLTIGGSGHMALKVRVPSWVQPGWQVTVNGVVQAVTGMPGTYATIDRTWANGDVVVITMPMAIAFEPTPDNASTKAVKYGGMVLCSAWTNSTMPTLDQGTVAATATPLQFTGTVNGSTPVTLMPFYKKYSGAYTVYFRTTGSTVTNTPTATGTTPPPLTDPAVWYKFDETSGTSAADSSGNGKTATLNGGATWAAGRNGNAVNLSGSSQYVSMPAGIVSGLNDFTIATWVRLDTTGSWRRLFDFGTGTSVNMFLIPTSGSTIRFAITTGGSGGEQRINGTAALPTGVWKHVAVTLSGNTGRLYVDGVQVGQNTAMTLRPSSLGNTGNNWVGRSQYSGDAYLDGLVDDFRIYNRGLNAWEVLALATTDSTITPTITPTPSRTPTVSPTTPTNELKPIAWYKFDETSGTTAVDSSGSGKNATLVNGPTWVAGRDGNAVNLDGSNDYVSLPAGILSTLTNFTISTWVKLDTTGSWRRLFDFGSSTSVNMFLVPTSGSTIRFAITTGGSGGEQRINGTAALPTGVWKHVAVTFSGNTGRLYVDGVQVGQNTTMTLRPSSLGNTTNNWLGRSQYSGDAYLDGQIDQFRIYNLDIGAAGVMSLFQNPAGHP